MQESALMISHTSSERKLAEAWKALLQEVFGLADGSVWFSSDPGAIDAIGPFASTIEKEIGDARAIISIQSPVSRFRPWILWEAGMARALGKPVYVIVYERSDATRDERILGNLGTPLDPFEQFPGTDLTRVQGVIELLQTHLSRPLKPEKLNEALRDYQKGVKALENSWVLRKQIFEKRIRLVFDPEARQLLAETGRIADHVMVEGIQGSMVIFGLLLDKSWRDFLNHLMGLKSPWLGSAERWACGLGSALQRALDGQCIDGPEGLPLYFDASAGYSYRPSVSSLWEEGEKTIFNVSFALLPKELTVHPAGNFGVLLHYLDFCRMMRWGILEEPQFASFFRNPRLYSAQQGSDYICEFLGRILSIRTEFWNRGLARDAIFHALDENEQPIMDSLLNTYFEAMRIIDPNDKGTIPDPIPGVDLLRKVYADLLKVNKQIYLLVYKALGPLLQELDG